MSPEAKQLLERALHLEDDERAELANRLFESLEVTESEEDVEKAWEEEIERRIRLLDEGVTRPIPWEEARKMLFQLGPEIENPGPQPLPGSHRFD